MMSVVGMRKECRNIHTYYVFSDLDENFLPQSRCEKGRKKSGAMQ